MTYKITESDAIEGTTIEREATPDEITNIEARKAKSEKMQADEQNKQIAKESAKAKLAALGLSNDEIKALLG